MKILVAYRGPNVGQDLLELAAQHARAFAAEILLVTSLPGGDKTTQEHIHETEELLDNAKRHLSDLGVKNEAHLLVRGRTPGEDIVAFAGERNCAEILIGIKRRSKVGKMLFGSTAQFVILNAPCPVVSIK